MYYNSKRFECIEATHVIVTWGDLLTHFSLLLYCFTPQAFIQAVLLMSVFEQRWVFERCISWKMITNYCKMKMEIWRCCELRIWFMVEPWWGFRGQMLSKFLVFLQLEGK